MNGSAHHNWWYCRLQSEPEEGGADEFTDDETKVKAYPNPFSDKLNIEFTIAEDSRVKLSVFNLSGQQLAVLFEGEMPGGELKKVEYNPSATCDCMIFYRLQTDHGICYGKAVMVK